ncbi:Mammalian cell entry related domain protein [Caldithrix abyssi DSM 13497]|uniref:Mammalian cell entry related domain protein n=1 Tax=Caldithrix abyssi DSM 13497 TaxID=880073 RepID=H1XWC3_CALAY|nr:MlaD family protein [Caldithrix abyssi]APF20812.1 phospholipid/cholesterol/gamma-HCH transport system substrate-binding protein [Caldithrix abyssi DSM 13497]EHO40705.1 Mammalian cell entry related domain protein [Caldithrix abyssi DSM 13497]
MKSKAQKIRLGIFIVIGLLLLIGMVLILSIEKYFKEKDIYYIKYENVSVSGLDAGSAVKYLGVHIGSVEKIEINPQNISQIIVTIGVRRGTPIKQDVVADISTIGITGLKIIELRGGTQEAPLLKPGGYIQPGRSLTEEITGKAEVLAEKMELILNNLIQLTDPINQKKIIQLIEESRLAIKRVNRILAKTEPRLNSMASKLDTSLTHLSFAARSARTTLERIESVVGSDTLKKTMRNIAEVAEKLNKANIYNLDEDLNFAVDRLNNLLRQMDLLINMNGVRFNQTMEQLNQTVRYLNSAARQIDEDPSILLGGSKPENAPDEKLKE